MEDEHLATSFTLKAGSTTYSIELFGVFDGIYDVASTRQVAQAVQSNRGLSAAQLAKDIVYSAYTAGSSDNLTALVVKL